MERVQTMTLDALRTKLELEARHHQDVMVKGRDLLFGNDGLVTIKHALNEAGKEVEVVDKLSWTDTAFTQFCSKIEVPSEFVRRCPIHGPSSKKSIIDHWKEGVDGKTFLLRLHNLDVPDEKTGAGGMVRAFLTERFSKFDNLELVDVAAPFIKERGLQIQIGAHTDKSFHMRLLDPKTIDVRTGKTPENQPPPGAHIVDYKSDVHQVGIHVLNSEVGAYNLRGDFMLFRQVCTNGLIILFDKKPLFSHKHVGIESHEIRTRFAASLDEMKDRTEGVIHNLETAGEQHLAEPLTELRRQLKAAKGTTDDFITLAFEAFEAEPVPTRFGIIQAITRAAQKLPSMDQRIEMEQVAGRILLAA